MSIFLYQKLIWCQKMSLFSDIRNYFRYQKIVAFMISEKIWYLKILPDVRKSCHYLISDSKRWFGRWQKMIYQFTHLKFTHFRISEIDCLITENLFFLYLKFISDIRKSISDIRKSVSDIRKSFADIRNQHWSPTWRSIEVIHLGRSQEFVDTVYELWWLLINGTGISTRATFVSSH